MVLPCSVSDPELTNAVLHELRPGDHIRVTGYLGLPHISGHPMWLQVLTLELLGTLPLDPTDEADDDQADDADDDQADDADDTTAAAAGPMMPSSDTLSDVGSLERFGQYIVWSDPDTAADTVWTTTGELLGTAVYPDTCTTLIDTHQRRAYGDA